MNISDGEQVLAFETSKALEDWFAKYHALVPVLWIRFYKKDSGKGGVSYDQALDSALCYGWIDGIVKKYDETSYVQRFTPRRPKGNWSKRNTEHVARLIKEGKMQPPGLLEVEAAKKDGRWQSAYESPVTAKIPDDFLREIGENKKAKAFFDTLSRANVYAIAYRLQTAKKAETLERRKRVILEMLEKGEKFH